MSKIKDWAEQEYGENFAEELNERDVDLENDTRREVEDAIFERMSNSDYENSRDYWQERWD